MYYKGLIDKYRKYLPVSDSTPIVTLNEGNTPLIKADNLAKKIGLNANIYLKFEGCNPTGSFKDRGMTMAVTKAKEEGSGAIICASTGNTSASAAAYGAKAGLKTFVLIPDGYIALGKLSQAMMYGAEIVAIQGNFDEALECVREISSKYPITLVNSVNPYRIEGQKTGAFEVCDSLGKAPDYHFIPVFFSYKAPTLAIPSYPLSPFTQIVSLPSSIPAAKTAAPKRLPRNGCPET